MDSRFSHVTRLWKLSTRERTGRMKDQNIMAMNTFKNSSGFKDFTQQDSEKTRWKWEQNDVEVHPSKALFFFIAVTKEKTMEENYSLGRHSETHAN